MFFFFLFVFHFQASVCCSADDNAAAGEKRANLRLTRRDAAKLIGSSIGIVGLFESFFIFKPFEALVHRIGNDSAPIEFCASKSSLIAMINRILDLRIGYTALWIEIVRDS